MAVRYRRLAPAALRNPASLAGPSDAIPGVGAQSSALRPCAAATTLSEIVPDDFGK
jgi:hypothetical protein